MNKSLILICLIILSEFAFSQNQNISNGNVFDGEPYLSINPNNSQHIVVAWMGWINFSNRLKIKTKTSFDGGQTWSTANELPHTVSNYSSADPSIDFNQNGDVYVCYIDFTGTTPPVTGGVYISKSTDGGLTWNTPTEVINTNFDGTKWPIDRPWLLIDRSTSPNQGNIYVTTTNLNRTNPSFNPYLSVSTDSGNTFTTNFVDTVGWLAGSIIKTPFCSPSISSSGIFYGIYSSFVLTQSLQAQYFMATSSNGGQNYTYNTVFTSADPIPLSNYSSAKKGYLLINNPVNTNHLAFVFLRTINGDLDVFLTETTDSGVTWTSPIKINDDPIGNNRMQDLVWADFDTDGDLIISWRDRRNGTDSTYQTESEIWASYRSKDSLQFAANFQITSQTVAYDTILESAGNDFMSIKLQNDTLNAVWGDTRDGKLNIWFQSMNIDGTVLSVQQISSEKLPEIFIYPNPSVSIVYVESSDLRKVMIYDINGKYLFSKRNENGMKIMKINIENYSSGTYFIQVNTSKGLVTKKIIIP